MKLNIVPARTGIQWVALGIRTFLRQPMAMAVLFMGFSLLETLLLVIPLIGPLLVLMIIPTTTLAFMAATELATRGKFPVPTMLIAAIGANRERLKSMAVLGGLYALCCIVIRLVVGLFIEVPSNLQTLEDLMQSRAFQLMTVWLMTLYLPISVLFWHAPALVHWHGVPPVKSIFFSMVACLRNLGAFTMYGIGWFGVGLFIVSVTSVLTIVSVQLAGIVLMPLMLFAATAFYSSLYFTYRDSFLAQSGEPSEPTPGESS